MDAQQNPRTTEKHQDTGSQYTLPRLISGDAPGTSRSPSRAGCGGEDLHRPDWAGTSAAAPYEDLQAPEDAGWAGRRALCNSRPTRDDRCQDEGSSSSVLCPKIPTLPSRDPSKNTADQAYQLGTYAGQQDQLHAAGSSAPVASRSRNPPPHSSRAYSAVWALRKKMMKDKKTTGIPLPTPENFDSVFQAFDPSSNLSDLDRVQQDDRTPFDFGTAVKLAWQRANLIYVPSQSCSFLTQIEGTYRQCRNPSTAHQDDVWPSHVIKWCNDHHKWPEAISQVLEGRDFHNVWQVLTNGEKQSVITWDHEQRVAAAAQLKQLQSWVDEWH